MKFDFLDCVFLVYMVIVLCGGVYVIINDYTSADLRKQAIERGHAEYAVDSDGKTTWQWKEKGQ
jgi:hypothetical protein